MAAANSTIIAQHSNTIFHEPGTQVQQMIYILKAYDMI